MTAWVLLAALGAGPLWLGPPPPKHVMRVVTVAPSLTEAVVALGATDRLVGVSRFDELPEVAKLERIGGFIDPSVEAIMALKPDLVVVQKAPGNQKPVERLGQLKVTVLALPLTTIQDSLDAVMELGRVLERPEEAATVVRDITAVRTRVRAEAKARGKGPTVMFVYGFKPLVVAGPGSFAHELLEDCGARNIAAKAVTPYPAYSLESAVALEPEVVIDAADVKDGKEAVQALPPLKKARWVEPPSKDLLHPGPLLARGLEALCRSLVK